MMLRAPTMTRGQDVAAELIRSEPVCARRGLENVRAGREVVIRGEQRPEDRADGPPEDDQRPHDERRR